MVEAGDSLSLWGEFQTLWWRPEQAGYFKLNHDIFQTLLCSVVIRDSQQIVLKYDFN